MLRVYVLNRKVARRHWLRVVKVCALIVLAAVLYFLYGCAPDRVSLLPSEIKAINDYHQAFYAHSVPSKNDYRKDVHYVIYSFGDLERLKGAWMRCGYPKFYGPWPFGMGALLVPSHITKGMPEIWGVLHRSVSVGVKDFDKPNLFAVWHEDWHVRAEDDLRLLYPDSDPGNGKPEHLIADPRQVNSGKMEGAR